MIFELLFGCIFGLMVNEIMHHNNIGGKKQKTKTVYVILDENSKLLESDEV